MNEAKPLGFEPGFRQSRLLSGVPGNILEALWQERVTVNFHRWCMTRENLTASGLADDYLLLTTNRDADGLEFVSTVEHKHLPFYGVQWHPEKNAFEWATGHKYDNIPHSSPAIEVGQYFGNFFVNQGKKDGEEDEYMSLLRDIRGSSGGDCWRWDCRSACRSGGVVWYVRRLRDLPQRSVTNRGEAVKSQYCVCER
ncbi:gamma-glutamyl hydrolase-like [Oratosquilla oratoria]|uniref:gamma-glutamyl hydrolase-like n=1 Tax=Oratosquilla oratoria TaxID=337810 RepID=UPI003F772560